MKHSLARKIFVYFASIIVISIAAVGFFSYQLSSVQLGEQSEEHLTEIVTNVVNQTDLYLRSYERTHLSLFTSAEVKEFLDSPPKDDYAYYQFTSDLRKHVIDPLFIKSPDIMTVYLIDYNNNWVYYANPALKLIEDPLPEVTLEELDRETDANGSMTIINNRVFSEGNNQRITLARKIHGQIFNEFKGILAIEIKSDDFSALWKGINLGQKGFFTIVDTQGRIVYHPDKQWIGASISNELEDKLNRNDRQAFTDSFFGDDRMFVSSKSTYSGWKLIASVPTDDIRRPISSIRYSSLLIGGITVLLALLLSYRFGRHITKPIQILKNGMQQTEQGNWVKVPPLHTNNELDDLIDRYNLMVVSLSELMDKLYKTELSKKDAELERQKAELQSLQLQINPHFLYNTFENIICYAVIKQSSEITEIVEAIAYMFRYSVQTHIEETAIVNELKHVLNYMTIMKHRVGREFELDVTIPPAFFLKKMARLTLQPLIENIFTHAFAEGIEAYHRIRLDGWVHDQDLIIVLEDNGVGIAPERLAYLKSQLNANQLAEAVRPGGLRRGGIGLMNVHRRIQLVFGERYGLQIESTVGIGTRMILRIPDLGT